MLLSPAGKTLPTQWADADGNIRRGINIVILPVSLVDQWTMECRRYLKLGVFDVIPYIGTIKSRGDFWPDLEKRARLPAQHRIILATYNVSRHFLSRIPPDLTTMQAVINDASAVYHNVPAGMTSLKKVNIQTKDKKLIQRTIFDQEACSLVVDEAHVARKAGRHLMAIGMLSRKIGAVSFLTATPITTSPQVRIVDHMCRVSVSVTNPFAVNRIL